jgi:N-acetylglucosamine-6-phosphate deacetylase
MKLDVRAALVDGSWVPGDVEIDDGRIGRVGLLPAGRHGVAVPGFIDLQVNGFSGVSFSACDRSTFEQAAGAMARRGVTSFLPTVPTASRDRYPAVLSVLADVIERPTSGARPIGVHLEGPFLSPRRAGAHNPDWILEPDAVIADELLAAAPITIMTVAPERSGAEDLIASLRANGVVVSAGHSDADVDEALLAFDRGVSMVTHLWNAQRQMTSRRPELCGAALTRRDVFVGIIADGIHLAPQTVMLSMAAAPGRAFVVTDAASVAGLGDGHYDDDGRAVTVVDEAVRLPDGTLAGSATGMDESLRNLVTWGVSLEEALAAMTRVPALAIGRPDLGRIEAGGRADVVVVDDDLGIRRVLVGGTVGFEGTGEP